MMGTTDVQLEEAARVAADTAKYSAYIHAQSTDLEEFKKMSDEIGEYVTQGRRRGGPQGRLSFAPGAGAGRRRAGAQHLRPPPARRVRGPQLR